MLSVYTDKSKNTKDYRPFINSYNSLEDVKKAVQRQSEVGFNNNIIAERLGSATFKNIATKEVIKIDESNRTPYTVEAWNNFLNRDY